jgi:hypothetical protein
MTRKDYVAPTAFDLGHAVARTTGPISPNVELGGKRS